MRINLINNDELYHFNPYHDKLGRFAKSNNLTVSSIKENRKLRAAKCDYDDAEKLRTLAKKAEDRYKKGGLLRPGSNDSKILLSRANRAEQKADKKFEKGINKVNINKAKRKRNMEIYNKYREYDDDFDKTQKGKKLFSEYQKAIEDLETYTVDKNGNHKSIISDKDFSKKESAYLKAQGRYTAQKVISHYGLDMVKDFYETTSYKSGLTKKFNAEDMIKFIEKEYPYLHGY